jgi:hypothetical protein
MNENPVSLKKKKKRNRVSCALPTEPIEQHGGKTKKAPSSDSVARAPPVARSTTARRYSTLEGLESATGTHANGSSTARALDEFEHERRR